MNQLIILLILYFTFMNISYCQEQEIYYSNKAYKRYVIGVWNSILQHTPIYSDIAKLLNQFACGREEFWQNCSKLINFSINNNFFEIIKLLKNSPVDIDAQDQFGWTALMYACWNEYEEIAEFLIRNGANVNIQNIEGYTPLILASASRSGNKGITELLIKSGAYINLQNESDRSTALMYASSRGNIEIVKLLITNGAEINIENKQGLTALTLAVHFKHKDIIEIL